MTTLQAAFNGGNTIDESIGAHAGDPVEISNNDAAIAGGALVQLTATANMIALLATQNGAAAAFKALMVDNPEQPALDVESEVGDQLLVRLRETTNSLFTTLRGNALTFGCEPGGRSYVETATPPAGLDSGELVLRSGFSDDVNLRGTVSLGFASAADAETGGFVCQSETAKMVLRKHDNGTAETGALQLHVLTGAEADALTGESGDVFLVTDDEGTTVGRGFQAYRAGAYGAVARRYQRTFQQADLVAGVLSVTHDLDCTGLLWQVTDNTGLARNPDLILTWQETSSNAGTLTLDASLLNISGTWTLTLVGI